MKRILLLACMLGLMATTSLFAQGSGKALNFDGSDDYIQLSDSISIGDISHTFEIWVKVPTVGTGGLTSSERVGIMLGSYNSSPHFNYEIPTSGAPRIYWNAGEINTTASSAYDLRDDQWHHLAYVRDTNADEFRIYLDGMLVHSYADAGSDVNMQIPHRIGADNRTSGTRHFFHGSMDEIRIWDVARTESEIKNSMCQKVDPTTTGLLHYYRFDAASGTSLPDLVGTNHGTLNGFSLSGNASNWEETGAPIGDTSVVVSASSYTGQSLTLGTTNRGAVTIDSIQNAASSVHLYRVDAVPSAIKGLEVIATNNVYYGVFAAFDTNLTYNVKYDYANYTLAVQSEDSVKIFTRTMGSDTTWANANFTRLKSLDQLKYVAQTGRQNQFMLGNLTGYICQAPTALATANVTFNSADVSWTTGGATLWDLEFGAAGYTPGTGTIHSIISTNPFALGNLAPATAYDIYIRDNCGSLGNSSWVGPVSITTLPAPACVDPTFYMGNIASLNADIKINSLSKNSNLQYGSAGFTLGNGIFLDSIVDTVFTISGLLPNTSYDVYLQDSCNQLNASNWVGPVTFTTALGFLPNEQNALNFDGIDDYIQMANPLTIGDTSHTVEAWVRIPNIGTENLAAGERAGILLGSYGVSTNFNYEIYSNGAPRVWWNAGEINSIASADFDLRDNQWHHLAFVRDEVADQFRIYVDGELISTVFGAGTDINMTTPHRIGGDNRANDGGLSFHGDMDELRIWKTAKSTAQIRETMCAYIDASDTSLLHYYTFDQHSTADQAAAQNNGVLTNASGFSWIVSGAALGDESVFLYDTVFAGKNLLLTSTSYGNVAVENIAGGAKGVQLYRINNLPNTAYGILDTGNQKTYYGIFVAQGFGNAPTTFDATYDFSNFADAVASKANLTLYNRTRANVPLWTSANATLNSTNNTLAISTSSGSKEIILADFIANPCPLPTNISVTNITPNAADISWNSISTSQQIQYGTAGFAIGSGIMLRNVSSVYTLAGLSYLTDYEFYIGDTCVATSTVNWVGPLAFQTLDPCASIDSISIGQVTANSADFNMFPAALNTDMQIQWGPKGFTFGLGILTNTSGNPVQLLNLLKDTEYDAYFRVDCDTIFSTWYGPVSFKTDTAGGIGVDEFSADDLLNIFPNPSEGMFEVESKSNLDLNLVILDITGRIIMQEEFKGNYSKRIDLTNQPKGVYIIRVSNTNMSTSKRLIIM